MAASIDPSLSAPEGQEREPSPDHHSPQIEHEDELQLEQTHQPLQSHPVDGIIHSRAMSLTLSASSSSSPPSTICDARPHTSGRQGAQRPSRPSSLRSASARSMGVTTTTTTTTTQAAGRGRSRSVRPQLPVTLAEYDQLPQTLQRKYFSTFERLKIAQQSSEVLSHSDILFGPSTGHRPTTSASVSRTTTRLRKQRTVHEDMLIAQAEAHFYQSLPEKLRRQHFSTQEQSYLAAQLDLAASEPIVTPPLKSPVSGRFPHPPPSQRTAALGDRKRSSSCQSTSTVSRRESVDQTRAVLDIHPLINLDAVQPPERFRRSPTKRRNLSATRIPTMPLIGVANGSMTPASPNMSRHTRSHSVGPQFLRSSNESAGRTDELPHAVHYQDPEARMKLRNYLACPHKFDEAIEFGFPSQTSPPLPTESGSAPAKAIRSTAANDAQHFLQSDTIQFLEDDEYPVLEEVEEDDDALSSAPSESPLTPSDPEGSIHRYPVNNIGRSLFSGLDCDNLPSLQFTTFDTSPAEAKAKAADSFDAMINREMTLRVTLTRPDLRAAEDVIYGWQSNAESAATSVSNADPLALAELPVSDDVTGSQGPFAVKDRRNSGMLRRLFAGLGRHRERRH